MKITNISFVYNYFHIFLYTHFLLGTWKLNVKSMILSFRSKLLQLSYLSSFSRLYFSLSPTGSCWSWKCSPFSHCWIIFPPHPWLSSTLIINESSPPTLPSLKAFRYCQQCFLKHFSGKKWHALASNILAQGRWLSLWFLDNENNQSHTNHQLQN